jgi:hypothetical protein
VDDLLFFLAFLLPGGLPRLAVPLEEDSYLRGVFRLSSCVFLDLAVWVISGIIAQMVSLTPGGQLSAK